jgi:hypothetical protein
VTAEIITFPSPHLAAVTVEGPPLVGRAMPVPANVLAPAATRANAPANGVAGAALTLVAACRELAASLAILGAQCRSADSVMAELGDGAAAIADNADAVRHSTEPLS